MNAVALLLASGIATWMLRASFIAFGSGRTLPAGLERLLAHTRPAVLAALVTSALLAAGGGRPLEVPLGWMIATGAVVVVARRTSSMFATVAAGIGTIAVVSLVGM